MFNVQRRLSGFGRIPLIFHRVFFLCSLLFAAGLLPAQDNSPYSRYGLGDLHPGNNIFNRGMAGISAGFSDYPAELYNSNPYANLSYPSINFLNPASYSRFYSLQEARSKKSAYGRMLLDVGINFSSRTLTETGNPDKFTSPNAYFSYLQLGVPLRKNWGLVFGLRPLSTISYNIEKREKVFDPNTGQPIDSALTRFTGDGGSYLFNTGTGFAIKNFSAGINAGYLFGKKDYSTRRDLFIDTVPAYYRGSNHQTKNSFGGLFFNAGMQYRVDLKKNKSKYLQLGVFGNVKQQLTTHSDIIRETYFKGSDGGDYRLDSVSEQLDVKGKLDYPAMFGGGFVIEQLPDSIKTGWLLGIDFIHNGWDNYRFSGLADAVRSNWQLKIGGQLKPALKQSRYKNLVAYRAGIFFGDDYIYLGQKLQEWGITAGISLPVANLKDAARRFRTQYSVVNISAEYIKRGNNKNPLHENLFRLSVGFTLSDRWFTKRKYD